MVMSPEEKLLIAVYSKKIFEGNLLRQDPPHCCGREIDLYNTDVLFKDIKINSQDFTLIEPLCPICGRRVEATFHTVH